VAPILKKQIAAEASVMTDGSELYVKVGGEFAERQSVNHSAGEYVNPIMPWIHSNTVEASFALLKRELHGTFHSVSEQHLQRYITELGPSDQARRGRFPAYYCYPQGHREKASPCLDRAQQGLESLQSCRRSRSGQATRRTTSHAELQ
jgi:hypothetical protein